MHDAPPILRSFARSWRMAGRADTTIDGYCYVLGRLAEHLGGGDALLCANRDQLEAWVEHRMGQVSPAAVGFDVRAMRAFYRWATEEGEIAVNPAARLKHPKVDEPPVAVATETDLKRLLATCDRGTRLGRRDAAILALFAWAGLRRSEVAVLDVADVDLDRRSLQVPRTKVGRPRSVPLHTDAVALIDRWLRVRGFDAGPLFLTRGGKRMSPNAITQMFNNRSKAAGVEGLGTHAFRRGLAVRWLSEGGSESGLRALAGWTSTRMVASYTRMAAEELAHDEYRRLIG